MSKNKQQKLISDEVSNPIANAADRLVDLQAEYDNAEKQLKEQESRVISLMKKEGRLQFVHQKKRFSLITKDPKERLKVKEEKPDAYLEKQ